MIHNKPSRKRDILRYLMVIPLALLAGFLLQKSFGSNDHEKDALALTQQEKLRAIEKEEKIRENAEKMHLRLNINGEEISIDNKEELQMLGEELKHNFRKVFLKEFNQELKTWKKEDLPELKRELKKLKKHLRKDIKAKLAQELKALDKKENLDQLERELLQNIKELIEDVTIDIE